MQRYFEPLFIGIPVEQIPFSSWLEWFDKIGKKKPKNAGHLLRRLKSILSFCIRRHLIGGSPVLQLRTEDVGSQPERGTRVLTMRELAQIWIAFEQSRASRGLKLAAKLVILLGCRSGEALGAQWSEFNMEEQIWTVPAARAKCGAPIRRPIPSRVMVLLQEAAARSRLRGGPVCRSPVNPKQSLSSASLIQLAERVRDKLDLPYWRMHDMRRTLSTRLSEEHVMPQVTERMLGHRMAGVMAIYNLHDWIDEQREAYELWDTKLMEAVKSLQDI
ncbi:tyrosine-type recombinase/integrase [Aeromonas hydrophila]|uniref:tyrosine-type recombinase/integrase n=1 Tax=Aeromonas hydrophila TaxID=644 RepID=UPI001E3C2FD6|nr:site-specific integrase [Aeromonas hydrophila]